MRKGCCCFGRLLHKRNKLSAHRLLTVEQIYAQGPQVALQGVDHSDPAQRRQLKAPYRAWGCLGMRMGQDGIAAGDEATGLVGTIGAARPAGPRLH